MHGGRPVHSRDGLGRTIVDARQQRVSGAPNAIFEPDDANLSKAGVMAAHSFVDGRSGMIPVQLLNVDGAAKLYKERGLGTVNVAPQTASACRSARTRAARKPWTRIA